MIRRSYYLGWTTAHIADDLQIAQGTVRSRLHYAVRALRQTLQEMGAIHHAIPTGALARVHSSDEFTLWDVSDVLISLSSTEHLGSAARHALTSEGCVASGVTWMSI